MQLEWRDWRWIGVEPSTVVVVAPDSRTWARLEREAEVMTRFRARAGAVVPRILSSDPVARVQRRQRGDGITGHDIERLVFASPWLPDSATRYRGDLALTARGVRLAADLGRTIALLHSADPDGVAEEDRGDTEARAAEVVHHELGDGALLRALRRAYAWRAALPRDLVASHGDPHLFNMFVDGATGALRTLIDYGDVRLAHRADDLRYLHSSGGPFARAALAAYAAVSGVTVDEDTVGRYHVVAALDHFAFVAPDAPRFPEIVDWATAAIAAFAPDW